MRRISPITLLLSAAVLLLGSLAVFLLSARWTAPQMNQANPSSVPFLLYDTRACAQHPSASTCDGRLPIADWDAGTFAGRDGEEACLNGSLQDITHVDILADKHSIGQMSLMWAPACQSHYVQVEIHTPARATGMRITQLDPTAPAGAPGTPPQRTYSSFLDYGGGFSEENRAVSPLVFQQHGAGRLTATTVITLPDNTATQAILEWTPKL